MSRAFLILFLFFSCPSRGAVELRTSLLPSVANTGRADLILSTHSTLLLGAGQLWIGPYLGYELISQTITDSTYGASIRFGQTQYLELQGGVFQRSFRQQSTAMTGNGFAGNLVLGTYFNNHFGLDLALSYKRIQSGMDQRTTVDLLPFLDLKQDF